MSDTNHALLRTEGLVKQFKRRVVVRDVSIELHPGEIVGLLGPNGAGKTTTFRMIVGLLRPDNGGIYFQDRDVTRLPMYRRAREGMAYLPQEASVFRKLTVRQNLLAIMEYLPLSAAERELRAALTLAPDDVAARNNLAEVLSSMGCPESARREIAIAARRAEGGPLAAAVASTQRRIDTSSGTDGPGCPAE